MSNPSEMQRLIEEREHIRALVSKFMYRDKKTKEQLLRELREVEDRLGVESKNYNSSDF